MRHVRCIHFIFVLFQLSSSEQNHPHPPTQRSGPWQQRAGKSRRRGPVVVLAGNLTWNEVIKPLSGANGLHQGVFYVDSHFLGIYVWKKCCHVILYPSSGLLLGEGLHMFIVYSAACKYTCFILQYWIQPAVKCCKHCYIAGFVLVCSLPK